MASVVDSHCVLQLLAALSANHLQGLVTYHAAGVELMVCACSNKVMFTACVAHALEAACPKVLNQLCRQQVGPAPCAAVQHWPIMGACQLAQQCLVTLCAEYHKI